MDVTCLDGGTGGQRWTETGSGDGKEVNEGKPVDLERIAEGLIVVVNPESRVNLGDFHYIPLISPFRIFHPPSPQVKGEAEGGRPVMQAT
jgi:hypothetical protein